MKYILITSLVLIHLLLASPIGLAQTASEIEYWQSVKNSNDVDMLNAYLQEYPDGKFKNLAEIKIKKLGGTVTSSQTNNAELKPSTASIMANKKWCGRSGIASEMSPQDCLNKDGVPVPNKSWADWIVNTYFGKYEKHKAFAVSDDSWGVAAYRGNPAVAKKLALYDCNLRANKATTCLVVNLNGSYSEYSDFSKSSDPVFSAFGNLSEIDGRYKIILSSQADSGWEGFLNVDVVGSDIRGNARMCWGNNSCATYSIKTVHAKARGRYFQATMRKTKANGALASRLSREQELFVAFSSDASSMKGRINQFTFDGERYSRAN